MSTSQRKNVIIYKHGSVVMYVFCAVETMFSLCLRLLEMGLIMRESWRSCFLQECVWECSWQCASLPAMLLDGKVSQLETPLRKIWVLISCWQHIMRVIFELRPVAFIVLDANSTEFNPESKYPVVGFFFPPFLTSHWKLRLYQNQSTPQFFLTGDWNARAQPRANGWDDAVGEETDYFQIQKQRNEYVSEVNGELLSFSCCTPSFWWWIIHSSRKTVRKCGPHWWEAQAQIRGREQIECLKHFLHNLQYVFILCVLSYL